MSTAVALFSLLLVLAVPASGRAGALVAGLSGLATTIAVSGAPAAVLAREAPAGLWLSGHVIAIIATGIFFHHCQQARGVAATSAATIGVDPRRLWTLCFLIAPFTESVTGFGVRYMIALAVLRRLGLDGLPTLPRRLDSQSPVPWGALAVGTTLGATLGGPPPNELGLRSAILQVPDPSFLPCLLPTAVLAALRFWRDERPIARASQARRGSVHHTLRSPPRFAPRVWYLRCAMCSGPCRP